MSASGHQPFTPNLLNSATGFNGLVHGRHGYFVYNRNDVYIGRSLEQYGEFSEQEFSLLAQIVRAGDVVIEVGANIGSHTVGLAKTVGEKGRIHAFEPQRVVYQNLCANVSLNSLANVDCHQVAVGRTAGEVLIPEIRYDVEGNFGGVNVKQFDHGTAVPEVRLDDYLPLPGFRLLKIDVEGMEQQVLEGATGLIKKCRPAMYIENDRLDLSTALIEYIQSLNYSMYWHLPPLFNPDNFAQNRTNVFDQIVSINMLCIPDEQDSQIDGLRRVSSPVDHPLRQ